MEPSNAELSMPIESAIGINSNNMTNASQTEIKVEYVKHTWVVKNFGHCYSEYLENFVYLRRRNEDPLTWSVKIYPKGNGENNKDFVFLCLNRVMNNNGKNNKIGFKSRFFLKNSESKDIEMRIHPNPSHSDYVSYIKRDVLFPQISPSDSITVLVEIDVAVETITTTMDDHQLAVCNYEKQLSDDYLKLLTDGLLTDFTVKVGEKEIDVHKAILAARSPVFAAMLNHESTSEAKTGVLVIKDVEYSVIKEMLHFIYSGRSSSDLNDQQASDLLIAADKYRLDELKNYCELSLIHLLTTENACQLLVIGDLYRAEILKGRALQFIQQSVTNITSTLGWENLLSSHQHLVTEVVRSFDKVTSQPILSSGQIPSSSSLANFGSGTGGGGGDH